MIAHLDGVISHKGLNRIILNVNGVGYRVECGLLTLEALPPVGEGAALFIHTHVSQDDIRLFGFLSADGVKMFEKLLTVSRVGPKVAVAVLGQLPPADLQHAIVAGDVKRLSGISGVGKRTAERIIVDLGPAMRTLSLDVALPTGTISPPGSTLAGTLERALVSLGYKERDIAPVVRALQSEIESDAPVEMLLKAALKLIQ